MWGKLRRNQQVDEYIKRGAFEGISRVLHRDREQAERRDEKSQQLKPCSWWNVGWEQSKVLALWTPSDYFRPVGLQELRASQEGQGWTKRLVLSMISRIYNKLSTINIWGTTIACALRCSCLGFELTRHPSLPAYLWSPVKSSTVRSYPTSQPWCTVPPCSSGIIFWSTPQCWLFSSAWDH